MFVPQMAGREGRGKAASWLDFKASNYLAVG